MFREKARDAGAAVKELCEIWLPEGRFSDATEEEICKYGKLLENMCRNLIHFVSGGEKKRHFWHHPEELEGDFVRASQCSIFASQYRRSQSSDFNEELLEALPTKENCLQTSLADPKLSHCQRMTRVEPCHHTFMDWCKEQDCTSAQLAGWLLWLEHYPQQQATARLECKAFLGEVPEVQRTVTWNEAISF